jgi:hypothetical protein
VRTRLEHDTARTGSDLTKLADRKLSSYLCLGLLVLVIVLFAGIRYRLRTMPLERDEGEYAYAGQLILQGIPPYQLAYNMKLPGTYAAYAAILAVFGQTPSGIHLGLILVNAATTLLVFFLGERLFGTLAGTVAAVSYAVLSTGPWVLGLSAQATHFVVLPALAGILLLLEAIESKSPWRFFWSGVLLGLAFLMKQPGIVFALFAGVYLLKTKLTRPIDWRSLFSSLAALALGGALPFSITCLLLLQAGLFQKFWFWTFSYARLYASEVSRANAIGLFRIAVESSIQPVWLMWTIAGVGLTTFLWCARARAHAFFVISLLVASIMGVSAGFYFRQHYFILMLPALSLLAGMAVSCATEKLWAWRIPRVAAATPMLLFLVVFGYTIFQQRELFFEMDPIAACRSLYFGNPFPEAVDVARFIKLHTSPDARIAVVGSEPEIYFYSHRHSATGYIYTYGLMEEQEYAAKMQKEMIAEIESARPEYLVYVDLRTSWLPKPGADWYIFVWFKTYVRDNYTLSAVDRDVRSGAYLPEVADLGPPLTTLNVYVFKRRTP